jgi:hypothetical protein
MTFFVPSFSLVGEAELPVGWADFPAVMDARLCSHGAFFLADVAGQGGRVRRPVSSQALQMTLIQGLDGDDNRLDRSDVLRSFSDGENVRMN